MSLEDKKTPKRTQRKDSQKLQAEVGILLPQAEDCLEPPAGGGGEGEPPLEVRSGHGPETPRFQPCSPQDGEASHPWCFKPPRSWCLGTAAPARPRSPAPALGGGEGRQVFLFVGGGLSQTGVTMETHRLGKVAH